ncbi:MAG: hypothetical protein LUE23_00995 [Lachnospiraceae bacterium]|nr:hypothetical protein [Lachnospiraceae bacterium]
MALTILFFVIVAAIIFVGIKFDVNFGLLGIIAALCIAAIVCNMSATDALTEYFPLSLFFNLLITTLFYGFANATGAMAGVAQRIAYAFRGHAALLPFVGYFLTIVVSAMGPGATSTPIIVSALVFSLAIQAGYHPILASLAVWSGTMVGAAMPWMSDWQTRTGTYQSLLGDEYLPQIEHSLWLLLFWFFVVYTIVFVAAYFFFGGYKVKGKTVDVEKPEPFTKEQKLSIIVVVGVVVLLIVPQFVELIASNPVTSWMKSYLSIQLLAAIGAGILAVARVAKFNEVIKNQVPWGLILTVCGMMFLMKFADSMNVVTTFATPLSTANLPLWLLPAALLAVNGVLTYFCDGRAVSPMLQPLYPVFVALGCPVEAVFLSQMFGGTGPSLSPFSTGGAMALLGCPDDKRDETVRVQMVLPWIILALTFLLSVIGCFRWFTV